MGHRLHVAKKYDVQYAGGSAFNYKVEEIHELLSVCCENGYPYNGDSYDDEFEVEKSDWLEMIEVIKYAHGLPSAIPDIDNREIWFDCEQVKGACGKFDESLEDLLEMLQYFYDNAEPNESILHLCFF